MEEGIARPIREFNKTKSLVGVEPFGNAADRWPGRGLHGCSVEPGSGAECTGLRVVGISVEVVTPRVTEVLMSQLWFLVGSCPISEIERLAVALLQI